MSGVDPVTAVSNAVSEIASAIALAFSGTNRKMLSEVKHLKSLKKASNYAEKALGIADKYKDTYSKDDKKDFQKYIDKFDKYD